MSALGSASVSRKRFFVGNLFPGATEKDVAGIFQRYGQVESGDIDLKTKTDDSGSVLTTFAFVDVRNIEAGAEQKAIRECNGMRWKKHVIKVQMAQESFLQRLQRERAEAALKKANVPENFSTAPDPSYNPLDLFKKGNNIKKTFSDDDDERVNKEPEEESSPVKKKKKKEKKEKKPDVDKLLARESLKDQDEAFADARAGMPPELPDGVKFNPREKKRFDQEERDARENKGQSQLLPETGKVKAGLVTFSDEDEEEEEAPPSGFQGRKSYHSSSEEEEETKTRSKKKNNGIVPLVPKARACDVNVSKSFAKPPPAPPVVKEEKKKKSPAKEVKKIEQVAKKYESSDEEEEMEVESKPVKVAEPPKKKVEMKPAPVSYGRRQYYESSDDDDVVANKGPRKPSPKKKSTKIPPVKKAAGEKVLDQMESFNSGFWKDSDDEGEEEEEESEEEEQEEREDPNERRLRSLRERKQELRRGQDAVKAALAGVDAGKKKNKKTLFEVKKEEEEEKTEELAVETKSSLFQDSDDEDEDEEDAFKMRSQFEGEGGERLLALQSRFANDDRFKIDSRFKERSKKNVKEEDEDDENDEEEVDDEQDRKRAMSILDSMIDSTASSKKKKKPALKFKDAAALRFDPDKEPEEEPVMSSSESDDSDVEEEVVKETPLPEVSKDKKYMVKAEVFSKKESAGAIGGGGGGFSFGFGGGDSEVKSFGGEGRISEDLPESKKRKKNDFLDQNPFKYDSSESEDDDEEEEEPSKKNKKGKETDLGEFSRRLASKAAEVTSVAGAASLSEPVFLVSGDARMSGGAEWLLKGSEKTEDARREAHEELRPVLAGILKKKLRSRAKRQEKMSFGTARGGGRARAMRGGKRWKKK